MKKLSNMSFGCTEVNLDDPVRPRIVKYDRGSMTFVFLDETSLVRGSIRRNDEEQKEIDDTHEYV